MVAPTISAATNYQLQSPLFGVLPGEIRNDIFALALMSYEDEAATYPKDSYWYRPGFSAPSKSESALLRTCKAAYAECQKVFFRDSEWAFWFGMCSTEANVCEVIAADKTQIAVQKAAQATCHA
jgi:hypothetical protein